MTAHFHNPSLTIHLPGRHLAVPDHGGLKNTSQSRFSSASLQRLWQYTCENNVEHSKKKPKTHAFVFRLFEEDVPASTVTFPLKKYFPWPLERATPTLEGNGKTKGKEELHGRLHRFSRFRQFVARHAFKDGSEISTWTVSLWCQCSSSRCASSERASAREEERRGPRVGDRPSSDGETLEPLSQPYPSVHRLLHLHGESPCSPVHHRITQLKKWNVLVLCSCSNTTKLNHKIWVKQMSLFLQFKIKADINRIIKLEKNSEKMFLDHESISILPSSLNFLTLYMC